MNVPTLSVGPAPSEPSQPQAGQVDSGSGRAKTVTSACERCRRRKIRCDGETPCATCKRFRITCVRIQKNDTQALEQRVRQLEAQIAEMASALSSAQSPNTEGLMMPQQSWTDMGQLTDFGLPEPAGAMDQSFGQFAAASSPTIEIPSIQVVDWADGASASPVSPVSLSPSPSLGPLAGVLSKPMPDVQDGVLSAGNTGPLVSPPISAYPSPNHISIPYLSPGGVAGPPRSRSSSISSLNLDPDWASAGGASLSGFAEDDISMNMSDTVSSFCGIGAPVPYTPTRLEAETLLDNFFTRIHAAGYSPVIDRSSLFQFLDAIDPSTARNCSCPISMARFLVHMAMAIGLRMETDGGASTIPILHHCYRLAFEEARVPEFWSQPFALEASKLVSLFMQVSQGDLAVRDGER
ncbi:hypothetical protein BJX61DRAFT_461271 [Aspergillus egyptiacus]|nr:hypothetical protein BJX61DRAFT_461271 [Aspergillus egyptiacus]